MAFNSHGSTKLYADITEGGISRCSRSSWKCALSEDTKLGGEADSRDCAAIQQDLDWLEGWAEGNIINCDKGKCGALHLGRNTLVHQYRLELDLLESSSAEEDVEVLADKKLAMRQQFACMASLW